MGIIGYSRKKLASRGDVDEVDIYIDNAKEKFHSSIVDLLGITIKVINVINFSRLMETTILL